MDRKGKKLIGSAMGGHLHNIADRRILSRWDKVAKYCDDWDDVRVHITQEASHWCTSGDRELNSFEAAGERYNAKAETTNEDSKSSAALDAAVIVGAGVIGLGLGLRYDPNKRIKIVK